MSEVRYAIVRGATSEDMLKAYLPSNYTVLSTNDEGEMLIFGSDWRGWTLDDYVIPRLSSGLMGCKEVSLSEGFNGAIQAMIDGSKPDSDK